MSYKILRLAALASVLLFATGCQFLNKIGSALPSVKGVGPVKSEDRTVGDFERVDVGGGFKVTVKVGPKASLKIDAQDNILKAIQSEVKNGTLRVWTDGSIETSEPVKLTITTPRLSSLDASGACIVDLDGVDAAKFAVNLSGASKMHIQGNAKDVSIQTSGSSEAVWDNLKTTSIKVNASGACTVLLSGSSDTMNLELSGASILKAENLIIKNASVQASGACNVSLNASETIEGEISGGSSLRHSGKAKVSVEATGGSSVSATP
jgi:hypothetical protein